MFAIEARGLAKAYGAVWALRGITLEIPPGALLSVFGPNGAGKTTLIKLLATLARPTEGSLRIFGRDPWADDGVRALLGIVSHHAYVYAGLTALENLEFTARMHGVRDPRRRALELLQTVGLSHRAHDPARTFSRGLLQRLSIARALVQDPPLLLLDEPYTGLDRGAADLFSDLLRRLRGRRTIVMTTHSIEQGAQLADRILILINGMAAYESTDGAGDRAAVERIYADRVGAGRWVS